MTRCRALVSRARWRAERSMQSRLLSSSHENSEEEVVVQNENNLTISDVSVSNPTSSSSDVKAISPATYGAIKRAIDGAVTLQASKRTKTVDGFVENHPAVEQDSTSTEVSSPILSAAGARRRITQGNTFFENAMNMDDKAQEEKKEEGCLQADEVLGNLDSSSESDEDAFSNILRLFQLSTGNSIMGNRGSRN